METYTIWQFLLSFYGSGWVIVAYGARKNGIVDLCQFVRSFALAPFAFLAASGLATFAGALFWHVVIPNIFAVLLAIAIVVGGCAVLVLFGFFVVAPAVKKAYGVAKPFSDRICIVLYRKQAAK